MGFRSCGGRAAWGSGRWCMAAISRAVSHGVAGIESDTAHAPKHVSQSYRERTHEGYACDERSMAEGIKQRAGRCHKGHVISYGPLHARS
eukprot:352454-Chlamydomonas_euryale.AAC.3